MKESPGFFDFLNFVLHEVSKIISIIYYIQISSDKTVPQVALRWLLQKNVVASVIVGATSVEQLVDNMGAGNGWTMSDEEV